MPENDFTSPIDEDNVPVIDPSGKEEADAVHSADEINQLKAELDEQKDKYIRLFAEFDNYKRRTSKEAIELRQTAGKEVIISMLDVLDDMERAENLMKETSNESSLKEGAFLIFDKFRKILQARGLKSIDTLHTEFDVEKDEAVSEIHVDEKKLKGKVVAELQKGYYLNDKLIRFAKVVVGK
ncbi:MAG: nucleotide exchange factor GrpE [Ginsengibacter sp.]